MRFARNRWRWLQTIQNRRNMTNHKTRGQRNEDDSQLPDLDAVGDEGNDSTTRANPPVHELRLGRCVATIWARETDTGRRYNVTVCRLYRDGQRWERSNSFGRDDLPLVRKALDRAHDWILAQSKAPPPPDEAA